MSCIEFYFTLSSAVNVTTVPNETTSFNLASLQFSNGFQSNVTVQAVNDVGTSNQSNLVPYNASSGKQPYNGYSGIN